MTTSGINNGNYKHGMYKSRLYRIWQNMIKRCYYPSSNRYEAYAGRNISICDEWRHDFKSFMDWAIANGYENNLSIDRIDNSQGYSPDNCRWADPKTQANNTRRNRIITLDGVSRTLQQWSEVTGLKRKTISRRLDRGWTIRNALTVSLVTDRSEYGKYYS